MLKGPIWIVDDDKDEHELIQQIFKDLGIENALELFTYPEDLIAHLDIADEAPFIIISDVNLPGMDGFELRERLLAAPNAKFHSVPFIFWSLAPSEAQIARAYLLKVHGFFVKEASYEEWRQSLAQIIQYWQKSKMPSKEDRPAAPQL
ncbi:response regulator [uncultured Chitinophaga sp.]|jgi:Response regulator containing CheY-like receiver, AAA-type ATPase, and DNA-binding domains|uniref:response regulator n=1 Tax=uncultured Chitinophaga sp. TaxID=339340 RepID=UPI00262BBECF|nr:response regulator [uncultured Chitinophaga sp.]